MADEQGKVVLDLDNKEFVGKLKESLGLLNDFGKGEGLSPLISTLKMVGVTAGLAGVAVAAFKVGLDLTQEAEKIRAIEANFNSLTDAVGQNANAFKTQLQAATKGLVDETRLMDMANAAMIKLGDDAGKIPELMRLAAKATGIFGGDLKTNFDALTTAIESGNVRALRQFGIFLDNTKVLQDYAKAHGTTVDMLTEFARKQAIANAAMEQAQEKFSKLQPPAKETSNAVREAGVAFVELYEAIAKATQKNLGGFFTDVAKTTRGWVDTAKDYVNIAFGSKTDADASKVHILEENIKSLTETMERYKGIADRPQMKVWEEAITRQKKELDALTAAKRIAEDDARRAGLRFGAAPKEDETAAKKKRDRDIIDQEKAKENKRRFEKELTSIELSELHQRQANNTDFHLVEAQFAEEKALMIQQSADKIKTLEQEFGRKGVVDKAEIERAKSLIVQETNEKIWAMEQTLQDRRIQALEELGKTTHNVMTGISAGAGAEAAKAERDFQNMGRRGAVVFNALGSNAEKAFVAMGQGTASAGDAMRMFMFGALADIAAAEGRVILLRSIWPPQPAGIAAGGALLALSGVLRGMAGGAAKGVGDSGGGGAGGGGAAGVGDVGGKPEMTKPQEQKAVTVQIQGNVYETEQTRTRLMEMIRESGDFTDFNLRQIGR